MKNKHTILHDTDSEADVSVHRTSDGFLTINYRGGVDPVVLRPQEVTALVAFVGADPMSVEARLNTIEAMLGLLLRRTRPRSQTRTKRSR